jgi:hypothetical protein
MRDEPVDICRGYRNEIIHYTYPYDSFPLLESHIHPKFVIFAAGSVLDKVIIEDSESNPVYQTLLEDFPSLSKIRELYLAWITPIPSDAVKDTTYYNPRDFTLIYDPENEGDDEGDGDSDDPKDGDYDDQPKPPKKRTRTVFGRGNGLKLIRTPGHGVGEGAQGRTAKKQRAPVNKRKVLSGSFTHNQHLLSEAALSRINQLGENAWTAHRIREWSKRRRIAPSHPFL